MKNNAISNMKFKFEDQLKTPKSKLNKNSSLHDVKVLTCFKRFCQLSAEMNYVKTSYTKILK